MFQNNEERESLTATARERAYREERERARDE